jgi:16S rRNA (guanine966-N2)-methyltransferase
VSSPAAGSVRIIGGRWRGTRLPVPDLAGLRPTSDRVRETLFNWLQAVLPGARVLDLFAGSGALGLEAVSRGAGTAVLVERDPVQAASLRDSARRLDAGARVQVVQDDALRWLAAQDGAPPFDIAFVDPPFDGQLWAPALQALPQRMAAGGWLYVESPAGLVPPPPDGWALHRELRTAQAHAALYQRAAAARAGAARADPSGRAEAGDTPGDERADTLPAANPAS